MANQHTTFVALLRGINVGGHTTISMADLKVCFEKLGFSSVQTYINSGNVIFNSASLDTRKLETKIEKALGGYFGHQIAVMVRSNNEMDQLIKHLPASWQANTDQKCNVIFLRHTIDNPETLKSLKPKVEIEELHYHPGVLFWSAKTSDLTKSNMIKVNKMGIYKEMTVRGLNTTLKIYDLMRLANLALTL